MNISTYESRIKALEDQLNPPGPGTENGLVSVVFTPDIILHGGESLNSKIAALMPMGPVAHTLEEMTDGFTATEYTVAVTPSQSWKAFYADDGSDAGDAGETISKVLSIENNTLEVNAFASSDPLDIDAPFSNLTVRVATRE